MKVILSSVDVVSREQRRGRKEGENKSRVRVFILVIVYYEPFCTRERTKDSLRRRFEQ